MPLDESMYLWVSAVLLMLLVGFSLLWLRSRREDKHLQARLRASDTALKRLGAFFDRYPIPTWILDSEGRLTQINDAAQKLLGASQEELRGHSALDLFAESAQLRLQELVSTAQSSLATDNSCEAALKVAGGRTTQVQATYIPFGRHGQSDVSMVIVRDLTDREQSRATLRRLTWEDSLTELPNRRQYMHHLHDEITIARVHDLCVCLLLLDVDRFKVFNNSLGHGLGDRLLQEVAMRLSVCVRPQDLVARMGGDEFALTLTNGSIAAARTVAARIMDVMRTPVMLDGHEFRVTVSIGIALYPHDGNDCETLMRHADRAMYRAKESGKNGFEFYAKRLEGDPDEQLFIETALHKAIERGELLVHYQPQIDTVDGDILGVEALVRWEHPERGLLAPTQFIAIAEETGLIVPLGEYVLRTACAQNVAWQKQGIGPFRMAVNVSLLQFRQHDLVEMIVGILEETGLDASLLELEITESMALLNVHYIMEKLVALKELGVHISIDDFGTGYSSLGYLKRFPVDTLKIDQSFVRDITHDVDGAAIVSAVIAIARSLGIDVVAEGVELREQLDFLQRNQCAKVQGYFFSPPLAADEFASLLPGLRERAAEKACRLA